MERERWVKIRQIFSHLSEESPSFRANYLDMVCEGDDDLRAQVENMLHGHDEIHDHPVFRDEPAIADVPDQIGQYQVISELGQGGMSVVYRASHPVYGVVALKVLPKHLVSHPVAKARFSQEAALLDKLTHPVVCRIFESAVLEGCAVIAMEEVTGPALECHMREKRVGFYDTMRIALDLSEALSAAHRIGIVHRDIKPGNILLADGRDPRLIDFGIAKFADTRLTATGEVMGTPTYMSPEQWRADPVGPATDIWSLGVLLFEMLAGSPPFATDSVAGTAHNVLNDPAPDLPDKSSDGVSLLKLRPLLTRMLEKNQQERMASMQCVQDTLARIAGSSPG